MLPSVTPEAVQGFFPQAPVVTSADLLAATDWAEDELEGLRRPVPDVGTRQERELMRAISAYALYVHTGGGSASASGTVTSTAVKSFTVGPIKVDRQTTDAATVAANLTRSANDWLQIAGQHFSRALGPFQVTAFAGVAR